VVHKVFHNPLLSTPGEGGKAALIHITSGPNFSLHDCEEIFQDMTKHLSEDALVIRGNRILTEKTEEVQVVAILAGLSQSSVTWGLPNVEADMDVSIIKEELQNLSGSQGQAPSEHLEVPWIR